MIRVVYLFSGGNMKHKNNIHYAWVILFLSFFGLLAAQGVRLSFGAFIQPFEKSFSLDRGTISLISTLSFVIYGISQPISGKIIDKFGVRKVMSFSAFFIGINILLIHFATEAWQVFILYGILASIGFGGLSNVATTVIISDWFNDKRGLAFGIMEAGGGAGQMLIVPASLALINNSGWRNTVVYTGGFLIFIVFPILLKFLKNHPSEKGLKAIGEVENDIKIKNDEVKDETKVSFWEVAKYKQFWFLVFQFFVCGITTTGLMDTHLIPLSHDCGFSNEVTGAAVSVLAGFNILGILLSGILADKLDNRIMLGVLYAVRSMSLIILIHSHKPFMLLVFAVVFGLVDFATVAPTQLLATRYFKNYSIGLILGWVFLSHQIGSALGAYAPGLLYDLSGGYEISIYVAIVLCILASIACFLLPKPIKLKNA